MNNDALDSSNGNKVYIPYKESLEEDLSTEHPRTSHETSFDISRIQNMEVQMTRI